jgi:hypothetical protein
VKGESTNEQLEFYSAQVLRLGTLRFFPSDPDVRGELVNLLWRWSHSEQHAQRVIDAALQTGFGDSGRECPTAVDLKALCETVSVEAPEELRPANETCGACGGTGWELTQVRGRGVFADRMYEARRRCRCRKAGA